MFNQKVNFNRRGVLGSFITTFIATIVIIFLLIIFALGSSLLDEGGLVTRDGGLSGFENGTVLKSTFKFQEVLSCRGEYNGLLVNFSDMLNFWGANGAPLMNFFEENNCSDKKIIFSNFVDENSFYCNFGECYNYDYCVFRTSSERFSDWESLFILNKVGIFLKDETD